MLVGGYINFVFNFISILFHFLVAAMSCSPLTRWVGQVGGIVPKRETERDTVWYHGLWNEITGVQLSVAITEFLRQLT